MLSRSSGKLCLRGVAKKHVEEKSKAPFLHTWKRKTLQNIVLILLLGVMSLADSVEACCSLCSTTSSLHADDTDVDRAQYSEDVIAASKVILPAHLGPGEVMPLIWKSNGKQVDPDARLLGLPTRLTTELWSFCERTGLMDAFWSIANAADTTTLDLDQASEILSLSNAQGRWATTTPIYRLGNTNMHWVNPFDEDAYEEALSVLKKGGFDTVLNAIGNEFKSDGLMIIGIGFIVVSHHKGSNRHADQPGTGTKMFNLLFPLLLPVNDTAKLFVGDDADHKSTAELNYTKDVGFLIGGDTDHITGECDYRNNTGLCVAVSIYLADINDDNVDLISSDDTALFPVPGNAEWFLAQKGRAWGEGHSLANDKGRKPFTAKDQDEKDCPALAAAGKCETDPWNVRPKCQKSCNIFIDDATALLHTSGWQLKYGCLTEKVPQQSYLASRTFINTYLKRNV